MLSYELEWALRRNWPICHGFSYGTRLKWLLVRFRHSLFSKNLALFRRSNCSSCLPTSVPFSWPVHYSMYVYGIQKSSSRLNVQLNWQFLAILVACIASFRSLYTQAKNTRRQSSTEGSGGGISFKSFTKTPWKTSQKKSTTGFGTDTLVNSEYGHWVNRLSHDSLQDQEQVWELTESDNWEARRTVETSRV